MEEKEVAQRQQEQKENATVQKQKTAVKVYNKGLWRVGVIDVYRSLIWTRKHFETGTVEFHAPLNDRNIKYLKRGNIITMSGTVESAFVEGVSIEDYSNEITVTGRTLSSGLSRRGIKSIVNFSGTYEDAMQKIVDVSAISVEKPLTGLVLAESRHRGGSVVFQVSYKDAYPFLEKLSKISNLGFRVRADYKNKVFLFEVYEGVDHSQNQTGNKRVIFDEVHKNLNKATYTTNDQTYKTHAIVYGEGEGAARVKVEATLDASAEGWDRRELIVDARDLSSDGLTAAQYRAILMQRGDEKLAECGIVECLEANTLPFVNYSYKKDYDLGDIVTVNKKDWGIQVDKRITMIQEVYENGGFSIVPTFGDPFPETIDLSQD